MNKTLTLPITITDYLLFISSPSYSNKLYSVRWKEIVVVFILSVVIAYSLAIAAYMVSAPLHLNHKLDNIDISGKLISILVIPVIEEILFRLLLRINRKNLLTFSGVTLTMFGLTIIVESSFIKVGLLCLCMLPALIALLKVEKKLEGLVTRNFRFFFYLSTFLFGIVHLLNFDPITPYVLLLAPILILPQLFLGSVLGFIRVRYGMTYAVFFHMAINAVALLVA